MPKFFLESIAEYYIDRYKTELSSYCFVFPGRRAGLYFRDYLSKLTDTPVWAPQILTINEFFEDLTPLVTSDNISLLFELHEVYRDILNRDLTFDEFISWGEMFLNDFNDIDKHLINAKQLYSNLAALKELEDDYKHLSDNQRNAIEEFWGIIYEGRSSSEKEKFIQVWDRLHDIYFEFGERLREQNKAYPGMHYRIIAEKIQNHNLPGFPYEKIIFAGFNALTPVEIKLFKHLKDAGKADFFWDHSDWIVNAPAPAGSGSKNYGAGFFIKDNIREFPPPRDWKIPGPAKSETPDISIVPVSTPLDQIREVNSFLSIAGKADMNTAIILTDESMLVPALHGIPEDVDQVNITMGYPLKNTPAYGLTVLLTDLQNQLRPGKDGKIWFHHKMIIPILQHQYISFLSPDSSKKLLKDMLTNNRLFIEASEFGTNDIFSLIFKKINSASEIPGYLKGIFEMIFKKLEDNSDKLIEREFIYTIYKTINRLDDILKEKLNEIEVTTWFRLLKKLLEFQTVPFEGEPLGGLQIMGILETRALDFENLIILDLNEGTFPRTSPPNTFIPYTLRKGFELPTIEYQDNIFSYYFFRLINRAKKVSLIYTTAGQGIGATEMSRFLYLLKYLYPAEVREKTYTEEVHLLSSPPMITKKTGEVMEKLMQFTGNGQLHLSPSSLSTYFDCSMRFYYSKIAAIKEPEEIIEDADARIFGLIFHDVAEKLYTPFIGKVVNSSDIDKMLNDTARIQELISNAFYKHLNKFDYTQTGYMNLHGKNSMLLEVVQKYIIQFLKTEKLITPFTIEGLEKKIISVISSGKHDVNIKGYIDRLDFKDGILRVIDYKTGSSQNTFTNIPQLFDKDKHSRVKAIFQTIMYSYMLYSENGSGRYQPGILNIKDLYKNTPSTNIITNKKVVLLEDVMNEFVVHLKALLNDIFDPDIPFEQTENLRKCEYCPYRILCRR
jgi:hypothetical protein